MNATLRVAAAQAESVPGDVAANVATSVALAESAADRGARVVVLPELFLTGYAPEAWAVEQAIEPDEPRFAPLRDVARARRLAVVVGAAVRRGPETVTLSILVVDEDGRITAPYDKQHLFEDERAFFTPGDHGASIVVDGWELGLGICYDGCFPEHAAAAARDGAVGYLCPSAYYVGSEHRRDLYYAARALDNGLYVVFAGLAGRCGGHEYNGGSAIYDPEGRALARVGDEVPAVAVGDLTKAEVERERARHPMAQDRRADLGSRTRQVLGAR